MAILRRSGFARRSSALGALLLAGCIYGFSGGGLPTDVKTAAILPFENLTSDPTLTSDISFAVREAIQQRLGLRQAGENQADAIVVGTITRYEPDLPIAFQGSEDNKVSVTRRLLQITVSVTITNRHTEKIIWENKGLTVEGDYETGKERDGRKKALEKLTTNIVDGAQSQW
jgi:hypothetical protein